MQMMYDSIDPITINVGTFLSKRDVNLQTEVTEIIFSLKINKTDDDADAIITKTLTGGGVTISGASTAIVQLDYTDYGVGKLLVNKDYHIGLGFLSPVEGHTKYLEPDLVDSALTIVQDCIRA